MLSQLKHCHTIGDDNAYNIVASAEGNEDHNQN